MSYVQDTAGGPRGRGRGRGRGQGRGRGRGRGRGQGRGGARAYRGRGRGYSSYDMPPNSPPNQRGGFKRGRRPQRARAPRGGRGRGRGRGGVICTHFQQGQCKYGNSCSKQHVMPQQRAQPPPNNKICFDFQKGYCKFGNRCRFQHTRPNVPTQTPSGSNPQPCFQFQQQGHCQYGNSCKFQHVVHQPSPPQICPFFAQGHCKFGNKCNRQHIRNNNTPQGPTRTKKTAPICSFYAKGTCNNGNACTFQHVGPVHKVASPTASVASVKSNLSQIPDLMLSAGLTRQYSDDATLRYTDKVIQLTETQGFLMSSTLKTLIAFDLSDCDICKEDIQIGSIVEYALDESKAVHVSFPILDYKWKQFNPMTKSWKICSDEVSVHYEKTYNKHHLNIDSEIPLDGKRLQRFSRFLGKVIRLNADKSVGYVQYGGGAQRYTLPFESTDCNFYMRFLNEGDQLSYEIEREEDEVGAVKFKCIDVKFLPIRYLWQQKSVKDDGQDWRSCGVQESLQMDRQYYETYRKNKQRDMVQNDVKYRRITRFNGMIVDMSEADGTGTINFDLEENEGEPGEDQTKSLYTDLNVPFRLKECTKGAFARYDQVEFNLKNENGVCLAIALSKPEDSPHKRRIGIICKVDKAKKCGCISNVTEDEDAKQEQWPFRFADCCGFNCNFVSIGTRIEYETKFLYKQSAYHAVKICLYLLPYQWLSMPSKGDAWEFHGIDKSRQYEAMHNPNHKNDVEVAGHMRIKRFQRKVIDVRGNGGLVMLRYNQEIKNLSIWFDFKECKFDPKYLRKGDQISYELRKQNYPNPLWKVVRVQFANFIPFYWKVAQPGKKLYLNVPFFRRNFDLEKRYNPSKQKSLDQVFTDKNSRKTYRRYTTFKGKLIAVPTESRKGKMTVFYGKGFIPNLFVDVDPKILKQTELQHNATYTFEIAPGIIGFEAVNVKEKIVLDKRVFLQTYSSRLEEIDRPNKMGKLSIPSQLLDLYKKQYEAKEEEVNRSECICFAFFECKGFNATKLNTGCVLEYKIKMNDKYNAAEGGEFPFKAVKVSIPMLCYRWQRLSGGKWMAVSREDSISYEETHNKDHKEKHSVFTTNDGTSIRRITAFKGKVLKVDKASKRGQVRINYRKEYGDEIGIWFNFNDCGFNPNFLESGDYVQYRLQGNRAVRVLLWLIPYKWIYKDRNDDDDDTKWKSFSYHECIRMENEYNSGGDDDCKDIEYEYKNATVTARRSKVFKTKVMFDKRNRTQCYLAVKYGYRNLGIRLPFTLDPSDNIRHNHWVQFELERDHKMRRWSARNVKKVKFESKEKRLLEQIQKQFEEFKEDMNTITEYKWKWKDDDGSYNLYVPDISNKLNRLRMNSEIKCETKEFQYVVKKVSEDSAVQVNQSTSTMREVKRFMIRTPKDKHVARTEFTIPDGEFYTNDYDTLNDEEIKQMFFSTVSQSSHDIADIEDVVVESRKKQYEVNLWTKCDQLKRSRDEVEKYLWHGSSFDITNVIIQNGFDRCYSSVAAYGNGTYFARDASYSASDRYSPRHSDTYKYMLLCKVIIGDSTRGTSSMDKVPKKADGSEYDTLVDSPGNASIYVAWRDYYAIPLFRIKFK